MEKRICAAKEAISTRLVKGEDLNHHKTLFAGRTAEWFVESGFLAAATLVMPDNIVCLKIHGMYFTQPVKPGEIIKFTSKIVYAGRSSLIAYIKMTKGNDDDFVVSGFITFIYVDENTKPTPHNVEIKPQTEEDVALYEKAKSLKNK
jgi:acyl-CoA hydrolase